jgi:hypothetical protein
MSSFLRIIWVDTYRIDPNGDRVVFFACPAECACRTRRDLDMSIVQSDKFLVSLVATAVRDCCVWLAWEDGPFGCEFSVRKNRLKAVDQCLHGVDLARVTRYTLMLFDLYNEKFSHFNQSLQVIGQRRAVYLVVHRDVSKESQQVQLVQFGI